MGTDRAVLVALLVGELVTNAAKHAYPEAVSGQMRVRLERIGDHAVLVSVGDDGDGLPDDFDIKSSQGFGMTIIRAFLQRSGARLVVGRFSQAQNFKSLSRWNSPFPRNAKFSAYCSTVSPIMFISCK